MVELLGTLKWVDLGMGSWQLITAQGTVDLYGDIPSSYDGKQVKVYGERAAAGFMMSSDQAVSVKRIELV